MGDLRKVSFRSIKNVFYFLTIKEWLIVTGLCIVILFSALSLLNRLNEKFMIATPAAGGSLSEGIVGGPRFINPVLALSDSDRDLTELVFSGLMRRGSDGVLIPDLAEKYTVSPDGLSYTFILKDNLTFHDGKKLTADDVVFTINQAQDPLVKSPKRANWEGITVVAQDEKTILFRLKSPFPDFLDNATIGIIPKHIWSTVPTEQLFFSTKNTDAIGSGPYKISSVSTGKDGIVNNISLKRFKKFALGVPFIKSIDLHFYDNEDDAVSALENGTVDQVANISAENAVSLKDDYTVVSTPLPRVFGLFFNSNKAPVFANKAVTKAIDVALDKQEIIDTVLGGYGTQISGPLPASLIESSAVEGSSKTNSIDDNILAARTILIGAGWKLGDDGVFSKGGSKSVTTTQKVGKKTVKKTVVQNTPTTTISFTITTADTPELVKTAELIKERLTAVGMVVNTRVYENGALTSSVIRPRDFEVLLFGQVVSSPSDLSAFWESSQRNDPGLNIASYANTQVDTLLAKAKKETNESKRNDIYLQVNTLIANDSPAVFLYSPDLIYATRHNVYGQNITSVRNASDRFSSIYKWYEEKDFIWKLFVK